MGVATASGKASAKARHGTKGDLNEARDRVLASMRRLGYPVEAKVAVVIDPGLRIMGYTRPVGKGYRIAVSARAVESGEAEMLLMHELSHVQRMSTGHPSHNDQAIQAAYSTLRLRTEWEPYMEEILHDIVNNVEDLYADGIAFQVLKANGMFEPERLGEFLQGWMSDEVPVGDDDRHTSWLAAHAMLGNARSLAQLDRLGLKDAFAHANRRSEEFLRNVPKEMAREFPYFCKLLRDLKEETTDAGFQQLLEEYMQRFVAVAEGAVRKRNG